MLKRTIPWPGMSYSVSFLTWESDVLSVHLNLCSCVWHVLVIFTNQFFTINIVLLSKMSHKSLITYENYVISRQKVGNFGNLFTYTLNFMILLAANFNCFYLQYFSILFSYRVCKVLLTTLVNLIFFNNQFYGFLIKKNSQFPRFNTQNSLLVCKYANKFIFSS